MNYGKKIGVVWALFLLAGGFASAQEITWDESSLDTNGFMSPLVCQFGAQDVAAQLKAGQFSVNDLQFEYAGTLKGEGDYDYKVSSNIGTPLYIILSDSFAIENPMEGRLCSAERRRKIAEYFLQQGADPNGVLCHQKGNNTNRYQEGNNQWFLVDSALGRAARLGNFEIAEMLLRAGADPDFTWEGYWEKSKNRTSWDYESSHSALEQVILRADYPVNKRVQMIRLLTRYKADPNAVTRCGMTPLSLLVARSVGAVSAKNLPFEEAKQMAQALLAAGADPKVRGDNLCDGKRGSGFVYGGQNVKGVLKESGNSRLQAQWNDFFKKAGQSL